MVLYRVLGFISLGLGIIGIFLPVVPTTPFVLLAAACFARSSERWHQWLLNNPTFGPMVRRWETDRCISLRTKTVALLSMLGVGSVSVLWLVQDTTLRVVAGFFLALGVITVLSLNTCDGEAGK